MLYCNYCPGYCCYRVAGASLLLTAIDINRLARHFKVSDGEVRRRFLENRKNTFKLKKDGACIFQAEGRTATGPHKSDLKVRHLGNGQAAEFCSTGEQKALLVGLVLATARMRAQERGTAPLLLLDEIAAHLDTRRLNALFDEILCLGAQVWLTGTDAGLFKPLAGRAQFFDVADGTVSAAE